MKFQMTRMVFSTVVVTICSFGSAHASTILTFGSSYGFLTQTTESGFNYQATVPGQLVDGPGGDPGGTIRSADYIEHGTETGVLQITSATVGQAFTLDAFNYQVTTQNSVQQMLLSVVVTGYLDNTLVGTDTYAALTDQTGAWYVGLAQNLQGRNIDTLDISLTVVNDFDEQFQSEHAWYTGIDNVELDPALDLTPPTSPSAVPEPSAFALLGTGLLGLAGGVRRKLSHS